MKKYVFCAAAVVSLLSSSAFAGFSGTYPATITTNGANSKTETKGYAGLNWTLGGGLTPALVLGVTNTKVKSGGDTTGANLAFHLNLLGGIKPGMLKLSYLNGKNDIQGELGVGYNFIKSAPAVGLGVHAPFIAAGVDGYFDGGLAPYLTLHTLDRYKKPELKRTATCPNNPGDTLNPDGVTCTTFFLP